MSSRAGVGHSREPDAFRAGEAAASMALASASEGGEAPVLAIAYATVMYEQEEMLRGVASILPDVPIVGCSSQGISLSGAVEEVDRVVGIAVICSSRISVKLSFAGGFSDDPTAAGRQLAKGLDPGGTNPIFLWYDPLTGANIDELLRGLREEGFPQVIGGGAGQPFGPAHKTFLYHEGKAHTGSALALQVEGCEIIFDLTHGTEPVGLEYVVTGANANILQSLDNQRAADVWVEQLGGGTTANVEDNSPWAIGVRLSEDAAAHYEGPLTRAVFNVDMTLGELALQAPIAKGTTVQICHRTPEAVYDRALAMAERLKQRSEGRKPFFVFSFECAARPRPFLGDELAEKEVCEMQALLGKELPWLGFYAWGELAPIGSRSFFHNYTFPLCILCDTSEV